MTDKFWLKVTPASDGLADAAIYDSPYYFRQVEGWSTTQEELWNTVVERGYVYSEFLGEGFWEVRKVALSPSVAPVFPENDLESLNRRLIRVEQALGLDLIDRK